MIQLTKQQWMMLRKISDKLDPSKVKDAPTQRDYVDDVPFLLNLINGAYVAPRR